MTDAELLIIDYADEHAEAFYAINAEWIESMFVMEPHDLEVLNDPRGQIIDAGGVVLFAQDPALGVIGTCALMPSPKGGVELTKMGVRAAARGRNAGAVLLAAAIARAAEIGIEPLYLLTHHSCEAAIHLYEKHGFAHDAEIMARYGGDYARCTVAMRYDSAVSD